MKIQLVLALFIALAFTQELQVDGNLKVMGNIDAQGHPITNVGEPVLSSDAATAQYVDIRTSALGRSIVLKCPWITEDYYTFGFGTCEPPECPTGWISLGTYVEITGVYMGYIICGNSCRICIEEN